MGSAAQNILLIGFMGCGKSTVGQIVAEQLGWEFVDIDAVVVARAGRTIPEIFAEDGEDGFRAMESAVLTDLDDGVSRVVATGGGVVTRESNVALLRRLGFIVWLNATEEAILARVSRHRGRPLLNTGDPAVTARALLQTRRPLYAALANLAIDTDGLNPDEIAYGICESARHYFRDLK